MKWFHKLTSFLRKIRECCQQIYFRSVKRPRKTPRFFLFIIGTPASGKTTLSYSLSEALGHPLIEFHPHDPHYQVFYDRMIHTEKGCILGDIPQNLRMIKNFEKKLAPDQLFCIYVKTDLNICMSRALVRFYCPRCHRTFLTDCKECEQCHSPLRKRDRHGYPMSFLVEFKRKLERECLPYFRVRNRLWIIDGSLPKEEVLSQTLKQVRKWSHHYWKLDFQSKT